MWKNVCGRSAAFKYQYPPEGGIGLLVGKRIHIRKEYGRVAHHPKNIKEEQK